MATSTAVKDNAKTGNGTAKQWLHWQTILLGTALLVLFAIGVWLRLRELGLPFDRDNYDEGVYWQSLRSLSAGYPLYAETFYSQPPFFLLSVFPTYLFAGQTLWAARLGIVVVSLLGLLGVALLGKALSGRIGAVAALLLLTLDPWYLAESQTLQAEAPAIALSLLAVAMAYLWWEKPDGIAGLCYAVICAISLSLSILCKLLVVSTVIPIGILMLAYLWRIYHTPSGTWQTRLKSCRSVMAGSVAFVITTLAVLLPFVGAVQQMWLGVVTFHTDADLLYQHTRADNLPLLLQYFRSLITVAALYGTFVALLRRDWRVLPLLLWLAGTLFLLWRQAPLFAHHLVALSPPMIALAVLGISPGMFNAFIKRKTRDKSGTMRGTDMVEEMDGALHGSEVRKDSVDREGRGSKAKLLQVLSSAGVILLLITAAANLLETRDYFRDARARSVSASGPNMRVARDLQNAIGSDQLVITDAQFIAGLAERNTPADLVDTSLVRINTSYVTAEQLIQEAANPQVGAVLFYTDRLQAKRLEAFHRYVAQHFRLIHTYGGGKELWIRV